MSEGTDVGLRKVDFVLLSHKICNIAPICVVGIEQVFVPVLL